MDLKDKLDLVVHKMRVTKELWVATRPENTDLAIYLHFWRGAQMVVTAQCQIDAERAVHACHIGARGFNATALSITFESYHASTPLSPKTGQPWMHRELQFVHETMPDQDVVFTCLTTSGHERGGGYVLVTQPYRIVEDKVEWLDTVEISSEDTKTEGGGAMFEALQEAMTLTTIEEEIAKQAEGDQIAQVVSGMLTDPERRFFHEDMATVSMLQERELVVTTMLLAEPGSQREEWITERLGPPDHQT